MRQNATKCYGMLQFVKKEAGSETCSSRVAGAWLETRATAEQDAKHPHDSGGTPPKCDGLLHPMSHNVPKCPKMSHNVPPKRAEWDIHTELQQLTRQRLTGFQCPTMSHNVPECPSFEQGGGTLTPARRGARNVPQCPGMLQFRENPPRKENCF